MKRLRLSCLLALVVLVSVLSEEGKSADKAKSEKSSYFNPQWKITKNPPLFWFQDTTRTYLAHPQISPQNKQESSANVPPPLNTQPNTTTSQAGSKHPDDSINQHRESNAIQRRLANLTSWLVILGFIQAIIIFVQVLYGVRAANAAKKAANAAQDSARAAIDSAEASRQMAIAAEEANTLTRQAQSTIDRPWVGVSKIITFSLSPDEPFRVELAIVNSGKTPALEFRQAVYIGILTKKPSEPPNVNAMAIQPGSLPLFPGSEPTLITLRQTELTAERVEAIKQQRQWIAVFGMVMYKDLSDQPHTTGIYLIYEPQRHAFTPHEKGNYVT